MQILPPSLINAQSSVHAWEQTLFLRFVNKHYVAINTNAQLRVIMPVSLGVETMKTARSFRWLRSL